MLECPINLTDVAHALELVKPSDSPENGVNNLILELGTYFRKIQKPEVLYNMWHRDKLSWSKFVRGYANEDELIKKFLVPEVSDGMPFEYATEVCGFLTENHFRPQNLYYISNESAINELRSSWGLGPLDSSSSSSTTTTVNSVSLESLAKELEKLLEGDFDMANVKKWVKVRTRTTLDPS